MSFDLNYTPEVSPCFLLPAFPKSKKTVWLRNKETYKLFEQKIFVYTMPNELIIQALCSYSSFGTILKLSTGK